MNYDGRSVVLGDFGLCVVGSGRSNIANSWGTPGYTCPEKLFSDEHSGYPGDIWSMGVVFLQMMHRASAKELVNQLCEIWKLVVEMRPNASIPCAGDGLAESNGSSAEVIKSRLRCRFNDCVFWALGVAKYSITEDQWLLLGKVSCFLMNQDVILHVLIDAYTQTGCARLNRRSHGQNSLPG